MAKLSHLDSVGWGLFIGFLVMIAMWVFPVPVGLAVYLLRIDRPFGDVMLLCIPLFLSFPFIGAGIGSVIYRYSNWRRAE